MHHIVSLGCSIPIDRWAGSSMIPHLTFISCSRTQGYALFHDLSPVSSSNCQKIRWQSPKCSNCPMISDTKSHLFSLNWIHWSQTAPFFTQSSWLQVLLVSGEESSEANLKSTAAALGRGYVLSQVGADSDGKHKGWYIAKIDKYSRYPP